MTTLWFTIYYILINPVDSRSLYNKPRRNIAISINPIDLFLMLYSGFLSPCFFALKYINIIKIAVRLTPIVPAMSSTMKKGFFTFDRIIIKAMNDGIEHANIVDVNFFNLKSNI